MHKGNKAAEELEARWRKAIKNKSLTRTDLDACAPCQMTGDEAAGYEPLREAPSPATSSIHFPHTFAVGSSEHGAPRVAARGRRALSAMRAKRERAIAWPRRRTYGRTETDTWTM